MNDAPATTPSKAFAITVNLIVMPWWLILLNNGFGLWGFSLIVLAIPIGIIGDYRFPKTSPLLPPLVAIWQLVLIAALRLAEVLPCDTACAGGGYYQRLAGVSLWWIALVSYATLAAWMTSEARRGAWSVWTARGQWLLLGVSGFFVAMMFALHGLCLICGIVHVLVLGLVINTTIHRARFPWNQRLTWFFIGLLTTNLVFHHGPVRDLAAPNDIAPPAVIASAAPALAAINPPDFTRDFINLSRSLGSPTAPWRLEFAIDLTCTHCADSYGALMTALRPLAGDRLQIVTRLVVRRSAAASGTLARYALAAGAVDRSTYQTVVTVLLGSRPDAEWKSMRTRVADVADVTRIENCEQHLHDLLLTIQRDDQRELLERDLGTTTPALALVEVASGRTVKSWAGDIDSAQMVQVLSLLTRP